MVTLLAEGKHTILYRGRQLKTADDVPSDVQIAADDLSDLKIPGGAFTFKGVLDCSLNPNYPAANAGFVYKVSVAGKIGGGSGTVVNVGDVLTCIQDGSAAGTQAAVGANWLIEEANLGYAAESAANKSTNVTTDGASDVKYPSAKAVKTYADAKLSTDGSNAALPTVDPGVAGKLWNNAGTVKVSAG
jgi:hypothetical protein